MSRALIKFNSAIKSAQTRKVYDRCLNYFLKFVKIREAVLKKYGVKVRGRVDYYISYCGHVIVVYKKKHYHLNLKPSDTLLQYF